MTVPNDANTYLPGTIQIPSALTITDITRSYPMVVTVSVNDLSEANTYVPNQLIRLTVPISYKMFQADGLVASILSVIDNEISLNVDSSLFDAFVIPVSTKAQQPASLAPSGSRNLQYSNNSTQVPFQSLENQGN